MNKFKSVLCLILILGISYALEAQTQEIPSDQDIKVKVKESEEVLVLIDGVKYDTKILDLLDTDRIESIDILKGKKAMEKYKVKNAIVVTTKKSVKESVSIHIKGEEKIVIKESDKNVIKGNPAVVIDGEVSDIAHLKKLDKDDIYKINIYKTEEYKAKYSNDYGVIVVETKKSKKK